MYSKCYTSTVDILTTCYVNIPCINFDFILLLKYKPTENINDDLSGSEILVTKN